jgi:hypothetical protein
MQGTFIGHFIALMERRKISLVIHQRLMNIISRLFWRREYLGSDYDGEVVG